MSLVVLSDFDGTIVQIDTAVFVLERFATGDWKTFDEQLERDEIDLEECTRKQFSLVKVTENEILKELIQVTAFRPNFEELAGFCKTKNIPFAVVTAGLDFIVRHFLRPWTREIEIVAPEAECTSSGIKFRNFPKLRYRNSHNFKDDLVTHSKKQGRRVVYIGDALNDYEAIRKADIAFVVRGSDLALRCKRDNFTHKEISDFKEVVDEIQQ